MVAAETCSSSGGDGDSNGRPAVKPPHQRMPITPGKGRKRKSKPRDPAKIERLSSDSAITTTAGSDDGGAPMMAAASSSSRGGNEGVVELQQQTNGKKPRLVWTSELHDAFVRACESLEERDIKVVPKNILKAMDVTGLTRENVASHLQKHRQNLEGKKGKDIRRRSKGGAATMMHHRIAPSLQPAFPQARPVEPTLLQAPSASSLNHCNQGSFAAATMSHPHVGHGQGQIPDLVHHQLHENFPAVMPQVFCSQQQLQAATAMIEQQQKMAMEQQAQYAAVMQNQVAVAPRQHMNRHPVAMDYDLGAQPRPTNPAAAAAAMASGVQSHRLQPRMQASPTVNMSGGLYCPVPQANTIDVQMETRMGVGQLQMNVEPEVRQAPAAEPAFAGSVNPDNGGQQEDLPGILHFWDAPAPPPVMDHVFPPTKPT